MCLDFLPVITVFMMGDSMMHHFCKAFLSLLLCLSLSLSMVPGALAAGTASSDPSGSIVNTNILIPDDTVDDIGEDYSNDTDSVPAFAPAAIANEAPMVTAPETDGNAAPAEGSVIDENSVLEITDYGADGTDTASDSAAIQAALDAADGTGATVHIPSGTWYLTAPLAIGSHFKLVAEPDATIIRDASFLDSVMMITKEVVGGYEAFSNVSISGGIWDGNATDDVRSNMIYLFHGSDVHFSDMVFQNVCGDHFIELAGVKDSSITNCTFRNFIQANWVDYDSPSQSTPENRLPSITSEAIQLDATNASDSSAALPSDDTPCKNITISGCTFNNCMSGIGNHHSVVLASNITMTDNVFQNMYSTCFNMCGFSSFSIQNNKATNVRRFIHAWCSSSGVLKDNSCSYKSATPTAMMYLEDSAVDCIGNTIKSSGTNGIAVYRNTGMMTLQDNTISVANSSSAAYRIVDCDNTVTLTSSGTASAHPLKSSIGNTISVNNSLVDISNIYISSSGSHGIYLSASRSTGISSISNCDIRSSQSEAITVTGTGSAANITGNNIVTSSGVTNSAGTLTSGNGIGIYKGATVTAKSNIMTKLALYGIYVQGATAELTSNKVYITGREGIFVTAKSTATLTSNQVGSTSVPTSVPSGTGIYVENSSANLKSNKLYYCKEGGIRLYKLTAASTVSSNKLTSVAGTGIAVSDCVKKVTLSSNTITSASKDAITASKAYIAASANTITTPGASGMVLTGSSTRGSISSNKITTPAKNGIALTGCTGYQISMTSNTVTSPKNTGIRLENSWVNATSNTISKTTATGIYLKGKSCKGTVSKNTISATGTCGISLSGCNGSTIAISSNTLTSTKGDSIRLENSWANVTANTISKPSATGIYLKDKSCKGSVSQNKITSAGTYGISLFGCTVSQISISSNTVTSPKTSGIRLENSWVNVTSNTISKTASTGIYLKGKTSKGSISKNKVSSAGSCGISLSGCSGNTIAVSTNTVTSAQVDGIRITSSKATVSNNTVTSSKKNGIYVLSGSTAAVKSNKVTKSTGYDIYFAKGCKGSITGNQVTKTSKIKNLAKVSSSKNKKA